MCMIDLKVLVRSRSFALILNANTSCPYDSCTGVVLPVWGCGRAQVLLDDDGQIGQPIDLVLETGERMAVQPTPLTITATRG